MNAAAQLIDVSQHRAKQKTSATTLTAQPKRPTDWIETPTAARVLATLSYAQATSDIVLIYGGVGAGKTTAAEYYAATRKRSWHVTLSPATAGVVPALAEICEAIGAAPANGAAQIHRSIMHHLSGTDGLLQLDEAQYLTDAALDQVRAIHDAGGVALALIGNRDLYSRINGGEKAACLASLRSRIGKQLGLAGVTAGDVEAILDAWGVVNPKIRKGLVEAGAKANGLRIVTKILTLANLRADTGSRPLTDADVRGAWQELQCA